MMVYHSFPPETVCLSPPTLGCLQLLPVPLLSTTQPITLSAGLDELERFVASTVSKTAQKKNKTTKNCKTLARSVAIFFSPYN